MSLYVAAAVVSYGAGIATVGLFNNRKVDNCAKKVGVAVQVFWNSLTYKNIVSFSSTVAGVSLSCVCVSAASTLALASMAIAARTIRNILSIKM